MYTYRHKYLVLNIRGEHKIFLTDHNTLCLTSNNYNIDSPSNFQLNLNYQQRKSSNSEDSVWIDILIFYSYL